ncbi:MAG: fumarylacetoacetate hydrolase family protein [Deltaproteobacteria bacterium]|nr:fumarylacetoacetate hydrolase family protein [Deltaproteobacteria bacterium]MBI3295410.1 fumarylacetoacetate hydrolase family protein [Deltaproteobacteria bacterium]
MDKIICLGRNYPEHAKEMGGNPIERPVLFLKPPSVRRQIGKNGDRISVALPRRDSSVHPECEIIVWITQGGQNLTVEEAGARIGWVTLGLDVTLRDIQATAKKAGHPWTVSKVFRDSAIVGPWFAVSEFPNYKETEFRLLQGEKARQIGDPGQMMFSPAEAIAYASENFPLNPGDILFTGTPAGVGPVVAGDVVRLVWGKMNYEVAWT